MRASQSNPSGDAQERCPIPPQVTCDDCDAPMDIPKHCIEAGVILGRLVCSLCTEDRVEAEAYVRSCQ